MSNFPVIIAFFTKNTPYEEEVQNLIASCQRFGLETAIEGVDSKGSWELNCAFKPFFIYQKLQEIKQRVLWVDADATFIQKPTELSVFSGDFAIRIHAELPDSHPSKVLSGTIFANYTPKAMELLRRWAQKSVQQMMDSHRTKEFWDQEVLRDVVIGENFGADIRSLPLSYCKIAGHPMDEKAVPEGVIEHYQASRRFKDIIPML